MERTKLGELADGLITRSPKSSYSRIPIFIVLVLISIDSSISGQHNLLFGRQDLLQNFDDPLNEIAVPVAPDDGKSNRHLLRPTELVFLDKLQIHRSHLFIRASVYSSLVLLKKVVTHLLFDSSPLSCHPIIIIITAAFSYSLPFTSRLATQSFNQRKRLLRDVLEEFAENVRYKCDEVSRRRGCRKSVLFVEDTAEDDECRHLRPFLVRLMENCGR